MVVILWIQAGLLDSNDLDVIDYTTLCVNLDNRINSELPSSHLLNGNDIKPLQKNTLQVLKQKALYFRLLQKKNPSLFKLVFVLPKVAMSNSPWTLGWIGTTGSMSWIHGAGSSCGGTGGAGGIYCSSNTCGDSSGASSCGASSTALTHPYHGVPCPIGPEGPGLCGRFPD